MPGRARVRQRVNGRKGHLSPLFPLGPILAICVSGSLFPEHPGASSLFITLGPRVWTVREPAVRDRINGCLVVSDEGYGGHVTELGFGKVFDASSHKILLTKLIPVVRWLGTWPLTLAQVRDGG